MWEAGKCNRNTLRKEPHRICEFYGRLLFGTAWHTTFPPDGMEQPTYTVSTVRRGHSPIGGIFASRKRLTSWDHWVIFSSQVQQSTPWPPRHRFEKWCGVVPSRLGSPWIALDRLGSPWPHGFLKPWCGGAHTSSGGKDAEVVPGERIFRISIFLPEQMEQK